MNEEIIVEQKRNSSPWGADGQKKWQCYPTVDKLRAENPKYKNIIPAEELVIQGVLRGIIRPIPAKLRRWLSNPAC